MAKPTPTRDISALHGVADGDLYSAEYSKVQKLLKLSCFNFKRKTQRQRSRLKSRDR